MSTRCARSVAVDEASIDDPAGFEWGLVVDVAAGDGGAPVTVDRVDCELFVGPCAWLEPDEHAASTTHATMIKTVAARRGRAKAGGRDTVPSEAQAS